MNFSETGMDRFSTPDGAAMDIHLWEPGKPKAVFLAIHGGLAHAGDYVTPALYFMKKNIATVAYDLRGHRREKIHIKSFQQFIDDTVLFLQWVKNRYKKIPVIVMGHSMGALIATHFGIEAAPADDRIKGYVLSSPYYENKLRVPKIMLSLVNILSAIAPGMKIPLDDLTDSLTHDKAITARHRRDAASGLRGVSASARFGREMLAAQQWVKENIHRWDKPVFAVVAGEDHLADAGVSEALLNKIRPELLTFLYCRGNYHENFNEINRDEIFGKISAWMKKELRI